MCEHTRLPETSGTQWSDPATRKADTREAGAMSRREFLASSTAGLVASAAGSAGLSGCASADLAGLSRIGAPGERVLLKGGVVLTMDSRLGDFDQADVLIEGSKIAAVGPNLQASATVIYASNMIVMPGFIDSHRHIWQGPLRIIFPNGTL